MSPDEQPTVNELEALKSDLRLMIIAFELKLKALRSDLRLMIIASVALNQFLANVALPTAITIPAIIAAILAPTGKAVLAFLRS